MRQFFTIAPASLPNGCIAPDIDPLIQAAARLTKSAKERRGFPAFMVKVDGRSHELKGERSLRTFLSSIAIGSECEVFANAGRGCTLDFDIH